MKSQKEIEDKLNRIKILLNAEEEGVQLRSNLKTKLHNEIDILLWILEYP